MSTWWSPKPMKGVNTEGIFSYDSDQEVTVEKSNRWKQQRAIDGTPHTVCGATALTPPPAGPNLYLNDLEGVSKATAGDDKQEDPDDYAASVVASYLSVCDHLSKADYGAAIAEAQSLPKKKTPGIPRKPEEKKTEELYNNPQKRAKVGKTY